MKALTLLLVSFFYLVNDTFSQRFHFEYKLKLDSLFSKIDRYNKGMGAVSIFKDGKEIYSNYYGFASLEDNLKPNNDTTYRIGSMTKMFMAVIILKQIEDNKLSLKSTLKDYFPEINNSDKITIEMMLKHRSGIANFTDIPEFSEWQRSNLNQQEWIKKVLTIPHNFEPNERFEYSNTNFLLLSLIAQKVEGLLFEELLNKYIIQPLKLKNTYVSKKINVKNGEALSYVKMVNWELSHETNPLLTLGAGAISSTPYDVNVFFNQLFAGKLINNDNLKLLHDFEDGYSFGFQQFTYKDLKGIGHGGKIDGFNSYGSYFPDTNISIVFTSNAMLYPLYDIWIGIISILFDYTYQLPLFKVLDKKNTEILEGFYRNENFPFKFHIFLEGNNLIMEGGGQKFALEYQKDHVFKFDMIGLVVEFFPKEHRMLFKQSGGVIEFKKVDE